MTGLRPIPVLLYHYIGTDPSTWISPFAVSRRTFVRHLELVLRSGRTPLTAAELHDGVTGRRPLPERPVVVTFDDGFADTATLAAPVLAEHGVRATVFATSGFLDGRSPGGDRMLAWSQLAELAARGHEIGAHSITHPELDVLPDDEARREIRGSKEALEDALGIPVRTFAYPHGYSSAAVRRHVARAGFTSACSVKDALASAADPAYTVCRLMVRHTTRDDTVRRWLEGVGAPVGRDDERLLTRGWRGARRARRTAAGRRS